MTMTVAQTLPSGFQVILCLICSEVTQGHRQEVGRVDTSRHSILLAVLFF